MTEWTSEAGIGSVRSRSKDRVLGRCVVAGTLLDGQCRRGACLLHTARKQFAPGSAAARARTADTPCCCRRQRSGAGTAGNGRTEKTGSQCKHVRTLKQADTALHDATKALAYLFTCEYLSPVHGTQTERSAFGPRPGGQSVHTLDWFCTTRGAWQS